MCDPKVFVIIVQTECSNKKEIIAIILVFKQKGEEAILGIILHFRLPANIFYIWKIKHAIFPESFDSK